MSKLGLTLFTLVAIDSCVEVEVKVKAKSYFFFSPVFCLAVIGPSAFRSQAESHFLELLAKSAEEFLFFSTEVADRVGGGLIFFSSKNTK